MKDNIKISAYVGIAFLSSFVILAAFLEMYSVGLLTTEKNILEPENIFKQNPKHVTISVLQNFFGDTKDDAVNINSLGFRGGEFSKIKPDRTYRIFMLGGSPMFGYGATSDETTIPGFMQEFLNNEDFGFEVEVINSGVQGEGSDTELKLVKQELITFSPKVFNIWNSVTWFFPVNNNELILFPSWLQHKVEPNEKATTDRISISFNTFVKGPLGQFGFNELVLK